MIKIIQIVFLVLLCSSVHALFSDPTDVITQTSLNLYFKYAPQDSENFGSNDHPIELQREDIKSALQGLQFSEKKFFSGEQQRRIFSVSQIDQLARWLSKGLQEAKPDQDIIFVMSGGKAKLLLLSERTFIAGRAFYKNDRLNIIIGEFDRVRNDAFESVYDPSGRGSVPYTLNHGQRKSSSNQFKSFIIPAEGLSQQNIAGKSRHDWLVVDIAAAAQAYRMRAQQEDAPVNIQHDAIAAEVADGLAKQNRDMRLEMARMRKQMEKISGEQFSDPEERIATLQRLRDKELITDEEYAARRQAILDDI